MSFLRRSLFFHFSQIPDFSWNRFVYKLMSTELSYRCFQIPRYFWRKSETFVDNWIFSLIFRVHQLRLRIWELRALQRRQQPKLRVNKHSVFRILTVQFQRSILKAWRWFSASLRRNILKLEFGRPPDHVSFINFLLRDIKSTTVCMSVLISHFRRLYLQTNLWRNDFLVRCFSYFLKSFSPTKTKVYNR